jgi:hypothetical protein
MAMRMTPGRSPQRDALVTASTPTGLTSVTADSFGELAGAASNTGRRFTDLVGRTLSSLVSSVNRANDSAASVTASLQPAAGDGEADFVVVTPIGADGLGVTTAAAVAGHSGSIEAMLPSGSIVPAELVGTDNGVAVVSLPEDAAADAALLADAPADNLTVVAYGDEFSVANDGEELRSLTVPEAAPIFDADGALVGLCTIGPDGVEMLPVESLPDVAPPSPPESSDESTTVVATEPVDTSASAVDTEAPATSPTTLPTTAETTAPASTDVATTSGSAVPSSEPAEISSPATTTAP